MPLYCGLTVAVQVTALPQFDGLNEEVTVVFVVAGLTVTVPGTYVIM